MNLIQLFRLSQSKIKFNRFASTTTITPVNGFHYEHITSTSDPSVQVLEEIVVQRSVENEKDRGYILIRLLPYKSLIVRQILHKYAPLPSDYQATTWQKWPTKEKIVMFDYEWKIFNASAWDGNRKLDRAKLLVNGPKLDDFDRYATKCLYEWLHG